MIEKKNIIVLLIFVFQFMMGSLLSAYHDETSNQIEQFWRILFKEYHFGYTLFGEKPISFDCDYISIYEKSLLSGIRRSLPEELWILWEKESSQRISCNFIINRTYYLNQDGLLLEEFYLINKNKSLVVISRYWEEFKRFFPEADSAKDVLEVISEKGPHIINNHRLLGLLLGYGDHNTDLFQKQHCLFTQLASMIYMQDKETLSKLPHGEFFSLMSAKKQVVILPTTSWDSLWEKYNDIETQLSSSLNDLVTYRPLLAIPLVPYRVDPNDPETEEILVSSLNTQKKIRNVYYDPNFLDIILRKLEE